VFPGFVSFPSSVLVSVTYFVLVLWEEKMVQRLQEIVADYEEPMREMQLVPRMSYGRRLVWRNGVPNRMFLSFLFSRHELAIQFLKDVGLISSKVQCNICDLKLLSILYLSPASPTTHRTRFYSTTFFAPPQLSSDIASFPWSHSHSSYRHGNYAVADDS